MIYCKKCFRELSQTGRSVERCDQCINIEEALKLVKKIRVRASGQFGIEWAFVSVDAADVERLLS